MRLRLEVTALAERQIRVASRWWNENRRAASNLLREELARGFELITTHPEAGPRTRDVTLPEVRRLHLYRIRYYLYYRANTESVKILAFWHTSRGQAPEL